MAEIDGGALSFKSVMDNDQINAAIDETLRRVQGLSDGTVAGGQKMDVAFDKTADGIRNALGEIGAACELHEQSLQSLEAEYQKLGQQAGAAFMAGRDEEYQAITQQQAAIKGEMTVREHLIRDLQEQSNRLEDTASKMEENKRKVEENANAHVSMRTRIKEVREEMMLLVDQGIDEQSEAYQRLKNELGRLIDIQGDVAQQGKILANDEQKYQGIIQGLSGLAGGFSAVTGAVSLFAGENEDLQRVMTKVQSVMAITMGMQQVAQTLNKDSAFQLVTLNGLKEWWAGVVAQATVAETAETVATTANTAAQGAQATATGTATTAKVADTVATGTQATAATAGTVANIGLAGAFRLVGVAIKSIPVFGWILAGISGLIGLYAIFSSKAREAKKSQEEFSIAMIDGCYKPIGTIQDLSSKYSELGNNIEAKKKFIEQNKKAFDELGVSVNDVTDAENLLINNKDAFISAQIAKAKSAIYTQQAMEETKKLIEAQQKLDSTPKAYVSKKGEYTDGYGVKRKGTVMVKDSDWQDAENAAKESQCKINNLLENARKAEKEGFDTLTRAGIDGANTYKAGTVGAIEQAIQTKQAALKLLTNNSDYKKRLEEIKALEKQKESITGKMTKDGGSGSSNSSKDPFLDKLEKQKKEYTRFMKWVNSGDETIAKAANTEFAGLLKEGATYIDYLKKQRETILSVDVVNRSKAQNAQLRTLNDQIAEETKKTVLETFNNELSEQLTNAKTVMEMLNIIEQKRQELANDGTDVDNEKKDVLDAAEKDAIQKQKEETDALLDNYSEYLNRRIGRNLEFENQMVSLRQRASAAETESERQRIENIMAMYEQMHALNIGGFEELEQINADTIYRLGTFEQKRLQITKVYEKLIGAARIAGQKDVAKKLEGERDLEILKESQQYKEFFGDISEISLKTLENTRKTLLTMMKAAFEAGKITADDYKRLIDEINKQMDSAYKNRGIESLFGNSKGGGVMNMMFGEGDFESKINSFKTIFSGAKGDMANMVGSSGEVAGNAGEAAGAMKGMAGGAAGALGMVDAIITAVYQTIKGVTELMDSIAKYKESMGEDTDGLNEWSAALNTMNEGVMGTWEKLKSGDIMGSISNSISWILDMGSLFNAIHDKRIEKGIQEHADAVGRLEAAYNALSWAIDKALGGAVYKNQKAVISNMEEQRRHLQEMWQAEESKKKTDSGKVNEYKDQYDQLGRDIQDMLDEITTDILQTDAKTFADELGDALARAFGKGEDAAKAFDDVVNNVMRNAVMNQLKKNFLEKQLQGALDGLEKSMGYWDGDEFIFDGLTDAEIANFKNKVAAITGNFNQAFGIYSDLFKDLELDKENDTSLTGAVKGVSEKTASIVAGQMNAIRINQMEATSILRQQLMHLATIAQNTSYNKHLVSIDKKLDGLNGSDPLRSKGFS